MFPVWGDPQLSFPTAERIGAGTRDVGPLAGCGRRESNDVLIVPVVKTWYGEVFAGVAGKLCPKLELGRLQWNVVNAEDKIGDFPLVHLRRLSGPMDDGFSSQRLT